MMDDVFEEGEIAVNAEQAEEVAGGENGWTQEYRCEICGRYIQLGDKYKHERWHRVHGDL